MRRVLVLGGTAWLGREIASRAIEQGAEVVCLARGESGDVPDGARLIQADRRHPGAYDEATGEWDEVVELSYDSAMVTSGLDALADRAAHWTLVSSVSVYAANDQPYADESADVVEPTDISQYPDAKVAAERASAARLEARLLIARPGLIVGPGDPTDRFGYWPARFSRSGPALLPHTDGRYVQVIDVADLALWLEGAGRAQLVGTINAVGEATPMRAFMGLAAEVSGFDGDFVSVEDDSLLAHDVRYWAGPRSLPLWLPAADAAMAKRDGSAYRAAGGRLRSPRETLVRTLADETARGLDRPRRSGLTAAEEASVIAALG